MLDGQLWESYPWNVPKRPKNARRTRKIAKEDLTLHPGDPLNWDPYTLFFSNYSLLTLLNFLCNENLVKGCGYASQRQASNPFPRLDIVTIARSMGFPEQLKIRIPDATKNKLLDNYNEKVKRSPPLQHLRLINEIQEHKK